MDAEQVPWYPAILTFVQLAIYVTFGCLRDVAGSISGISRYRHERKTSPGLAKLLTYRESFFIHRMYHRIQDVFNRPVTGTPGA
ncbi:hypothetical protein V7S43_006438 [Phytophthora oleae]|uniref:Uncharacterized protein n=1 Tax=Phytophthora oleae TaxID=2107226 RepID=A0ABD3FNK5_9STRA